LQAGSHRFDPGTLHHEKTCKRALHQPQLGDIPLWVVTATDGASDVQDQAFWLQLSSRAEQTTLEGGHDLSSENPSGVVAKIQSALDAIQS
jgi:hypothetical protein